MEDRIEKQWLQQQIEHIREAVEAVNSGDLAGGAETLRLVAVSLRKRAEMRAAQ